MDIAYVKVIFLDFSYKKHNLTDLSFIKNKCMVENFREIYCARSPCASFLPCSNLQGDA